MASSRARIAAEVVDWLLEGDPAIRWQTERDLVGSGAETWSATRHSVATSGWGKQFLRHQDPGGTWGGGLYQPKWTSTTYTLLALRRLGLDPGHHQAVSGAKALLDKAVWSEGGVAYWAKRSVLGTVPERCVNGMVLSVVSYFQVPDLRRDSIAEMLLANQLRDGGWNCRDYRGDTSHSSFHTTISVLEGLLEWKRRSGSTAADEIVMEGQEFMLKHRLFKSHRSGEVIDDNWTEFHFPPRWHYDVLRGLDYLRESGSTPDERAADAVELVESKRRPDGRWGKGPQYSGQTFFALEPGRVAGRWNTLRALRTLNWWSARPRSATS